MSGKKAPDMPIKALAPWFGGKRTLAPTIVEELGTGHRGYCEPFCGSMAVLMSKRPVSMEVVNDLNGDIINLARVIASNRWHELRERTERTLMCTDIFGECRDRWAVESESIVAPSIDAVDEVHIEAAYRFLVTSWQGRNGVSGTKSRLNAQVARRFTVGGGHGGTRWRGISDSMPSWHERLRSVLIDRMDGFEIMEKLPDDGTWALYLDPPYVVKGSRYAHDDDGPEWHARLAKAAKRFEKNRVVVSYYDHPLVRELYDGWTIVDCSMTKAMVSQGMRDQMDDDEEPAIAPELLIINGPSFTMGDGGLFAMDHRSETGATTEVYS